MRPCARSPQEPPAITIPVPRPTWRRRVTPASDTGPQGPRGSSADPKLCCPVCKERSQRGDVCDLWVEEQIDVGLGVEVVDHRGEDLRVEAQVDQRYVCEQRWLPEEPGQGIDIDEVAGGGSTEQRDQLAAGEFFRREGGSSDAGSRRHAGPGLERQVNHQVLLLPVDEQAAELTRALKVLHPPAAGAGGGGELILGTGDVADPRAL